MPWPSIAMPQLDWQQPWAWPRVWQRAVFGCAGVVGVLLLSPWWCHSWQMWDEAVEAHDKLEAQQQATHELHEQTARLLQTQAVPPSAFADGAALGTLARQQGLQFSQLGIDPPLPSAALNAMRLAQLPTHLQVQGAWQSWLAWLAQWPRSAPGVAMSSLELKAGPQGGISAQVVALVLQPTGPELSFDLASVPEDGATSPDPFNAQAWGQAQRAHAQQHPSYAQLVAPELGRPHDPLEAFPRERLHYVGQISLGGAQEGLVKVLPAPGAKRELALMTVHRVRVGAHVGQNFGRVLAIAPDHLRVQELAFEPSGEWLAREVRLPLQEASP